MFSKAIIRLGVQQEFYRLFIVKRPT